MREKNNIHSYYLFGGIVIISTILISYSIVLISRPEWTPVFMKNISFETLGNYNALIETRGMSGDIDQVVSVSMAGYDADVRELMGDTIIAQSGSKDRALSYYRESLLYSDRARVREKIDILSSGYASGEAPQSGSVSPDTRSQGERTLSGYTESLDGAGARIQSDAANRGRYLEHSLSPAHIREEIEFLEIGEERMDW